MKNKFKRFLPLLLTLVLLSTMSFTIQVEAAPTSQYPQASNLPMWYYIDNGSTSPYIHYYYYNITKTMPGVAYIQQNGLNTYTTKETFNLPQFLMDNPDFIAAGIVDLDSVWSWLSANDAVSPRVFHSLDPYYEYYCRLRNLCIELGTYPSITNTYSVYEKARILNDYMMRSYTYDYSYSVYDFQSMIDYGVGVCNAYAGMYDALVSMSGINAGLMVGPDHIWNLIQTEDGAWYEVDVTWNDCLNNYDYFMIKDHYNPTSSGTQHLRGYSMDWWITEDLY